jgi:hypothetical protein
MDPSFEVPREYFYALGAALPIGVAANDRLTLATSLSEAQLAATLQGAIDSGVIPSNLSITALQAARRITALGGALTTTQLDSQPLYTVSTNPADDVNLLVQQWLNAGDPSGWPPDLAADPEAYIWADILKTSATPPATVATNDAAQLTLVVCALTGFNGPALTNFITAIGPGGLAGFNVHNVDQLAAINTLQWGDFLTANPTYLPAFTQPVGTIVDTNDRVAAFLRYLQRFYAVPLKSQAPQPLTAGPIPLLDRYGFDPIATFLITYYNNSGNPFVFGQTSLTTPALPTAISDVFPNDTQAQQWLLQALTTINALVAVTNGITSGNNAAALQFSVIEALYARGFTSIASITALDEADFAQALTGSVAFQFAPVIWSHAGGTLQPPTQTPPGFTPINPGDLCDCVPPPQLSPLGPVQYLRELIDAGPDSSCAAPTESNTSVNFGSLLAPRRGKLGELKVTKANLATTLPVIDLVNECLEYLAAQVPAGGSVSGVGGVVYDTAETEIRDHQLRPPDTEPTPGQPYQHDPATVLAALPEYSSPASPPGPPAKPQAVAAYTALAGDYSTPDLPYTQPLDINRTYLAAMQATRFETMRRFRAEITEFALGDGTDPAGFDDYLWRYPLRRDIAPEYLHISADEYQKLFATPIATTTPVPPGALGVWQLYGFPNPPAANWAAGTVIVSEFLRRTGLSYCELVNLATCGYVPVQFVPTPTGKPHRGPVEGPKPLPECPPCDLDGLSLVFGGGLSPAQTAEALMQLAVFIRLWRLLQRTRCARYSFADLADICSVLGLFTAGGAINPDFIPELVALQILRDELCLPLRDGPPASPTTAPVVRTPLLALWADPPAADQWDWALAQLLARLERYSIARHGCQERHPELIKVLAANLDELSTLAGFDPATPTATWHHTPRGTLRFVEVLAKIYASRFTTGDIEFLFTVLPHLDGDDPFALQSDNDARDDPLALPDEDPHHSLWELRRALLEVEVDDAELDRWTWPRIDSWLRDELGYNPPAGSDPLTSLAEHAFPNVLERQGHSVAPADRRYHTPLAPGATTPGMWNSDPDSPISYVSAAGAGALEATLPLPDKSVVDILARQRQLGPQEADALTELYWLPRIDLAAVAFLFDDPVQADRHLLQERDEDARWRFFRRHVVLTQGRCRIIAEHLARHLCGHDANNEESFRRAWLVLKSLYADGDAATDPWESQQNGGAPPAVTWPIPTGGAFAALLGLRGTGLTADYWTSTSPPGGAPLWSEQTGALEVFGAPRDEFNTPLPTLIPAIQPPGVPTSSYIQLRNGFAFADHDGANLGGAEGFTVTFTGVLLVEHPGRYRFAAGAPTEEGQRPSVERAEHQRWRIVLTRGQREWVLLAHHWPGQTDTDHETELELRRGAYDITINYTRAAPQFDDPDDVHPRHTGLQLTYGGPDTGENLHTVPFRRLFIAEKTPPKPRGDGQSGWAKVLTDRYTSSLRDIRRTYQRAFKAMLLTTRFELSAHRAEDGDSELGFMLAHPDRFAGYSYVPPAFTKHIAQFDVNFLPVFDNYHPPVADDRAAPSVARQAALFDWWERLFDYTQLRAENQRAAGDRHRPRVWRLFAAAVAAAVNPDNVMQLSPHLEVPLDRNDLVQRFYDPNAILAADHELRAHNLIDERWAIRAWKAQQYFSDLVAAQYSTVITETRPDWWADDDPSAVADPSTGATGNDNLTLFVGDATLETGEPRRYHDLAAIDVGLRERARHALIAYLCALNRVKLPDNSFATVAKDLSDLLLLDVDAGIAERATRIDDAITAVQAFVERALMRLEPAVTLGHQFREVWECRFRTFRIWQACKRRELYPENTIECDELERARRIEAFRLLEDQLRDPALSIPVPAGIQYWPDQRPPQHEGLDVLQAAQPSTLHLPIPPASSGTPSDAAVPTENFGLLGRPGHAGAPSWLSPLHPSPQPTPNAPVSQPPQAPGPIAHPAPPGGNPVTHPAPSGGGAAKPASSRDAAAKKVAKATGTRDKSGPAAKRPRVQRATSADKAAPAAPTRRTRTKGSTKKAPTKAAAPVVSDMVSAPPPAKDGTWPYWIEAAIKLGVRFLRIAAAGEPAGACVLQPHQDQGSCCCECGEVHPPLVDEYYFWLAKSEYYDPPQPQVADLTNASGVSQWEDPTTFPQLLDWDPDPMVHLHWCRVHNREFGQLRRSSDGVVLDQPSTTPGLPTLELLGRLADSLVFNVDGGLVAPAADGGTAFGWQPPYTSWPVEAGWRYDLADDTAIRLPLLITPTAPVLQPGLPDQTQCAGLAAYPFFVYFTPGEPVIPLSRFAPAVAVATALACHCRYHEALAWYEHYYDPLTSNNIWTGAQPGQHVARQRAVLLDVLETMLCWGDAVMRAHTDGCAPNGNAPESFARARVIFDAAARILGKTPKTVLLNGSTGTAQHVSGFTASDPPLNPRLVSLYERLGDRLGLIHECDTRRRHRYGKLGESLSFWGDDPAQRGHDDDCGCGVCRSCGECDCCEVACQPESPYRFTYTVQRAIELVEVVRGFGQALLAAYEKGDAEYLASLRATQEHQLQELTLRIRKDQWRDADWQVQALKQARLSAQNSLAYYKMLKASFRNDNEHLYEDLMGVAETLQMVAQGMEIAAQVGGTVPDTYVGTVDFVKIPMTGSSITNFFDSAGKAAGFLSQDSVMGAAVAFTEAGWDRRLQDWQHQTDFYNFEIERLTREILGAERRSDAQLREVGNQQRQIEYTREIDNFLRDKFTNDALYLYHQRHLSGLYRQLYELALGCSRQAEQKFNVERGHTDEHFIHGELWDKLHEGLLAGERLDLDLRRMQKTYDDCNRREYELTEQISLQREFPLAFLQLKVTGVCEIEIPEWMFDRHYPGHYMRRIKNVALTIPCVAGPYTGVHCRLTLLSSTTRIQPWLHGPVEHCCHEPDERCSCCADRDRESNRDQAERYRPLPGDPRIFRSYSATEAIATSTGVNDTGLFQFNFDQPRYLPFEYKGAVSHWRIELPAQNNDFDVDQLTDVIVQLNYTAREGGEQLRRAATAAACCRLPGDSLRLFDLRNDFPDVWPAIREHEPPRRLRLQFWPAMFPFVPERRVRWIDRLVLVFSAPDADPGRHHLIRFWQQGDDRAEVQDVECVATGTWPGYFYGVIAPKRPLGPLTRERASQCSVELPAGVGEICSAYVIAHYDAPCWPRCGDPRHPQCCQDRHDAPIAPAPTQP